MKQEHLNENELQQFALEPQEVNPEQAAHIAECAKCAAAITNYRVIISALGTMEKPAFNFDLEKQILSELSVSKTSFPWFAVGISAISAGIVGIPVFMMGSYFTNIFTSISAPVIYLVATTALTIVIFQCRELLVSYRQKMTLLNHY